MFPWIFTKRSRDFLTTEAIGPIFNCEVKLANGYTPQPQCSYFISKGEKTDLSVK